ncbi:hypothetical protein H3C70_03640 [Patescibacteria group bacterium]|nr:hypothetical protein [Patescibacteria group bacterium]
MSGFRPPPPGALPPGAVSPDMADAMQDKMGVNTGTQPVKQGTSPTSNAVSSMMQGQSHQAPPLGSPVQEAKTIAQDVGSSLFEFLPQELQVILGSKSTDTPEEAERKRKMLQNYQRLTAEDRQYVQKKLQQEQMEKRKKEEEEMRAKQLAAQQTEELPVPEGKKTGEAALGAGRSKKAQTISKLQNDRKKLSSAG